MFAPRARLWCKRLETVKTGTDKFAQRLVAACQDDIRHPAADKVRGVADGIAATGAGIGHCHNRSIETEEIMDRAGLRLGLVLGDARGLAGAGFAPECAEEFFALFHAAGGGADRHFESGQQAAVIRIEQAGFA